MRIDRFSTADHLPQRTRTYEDVKAAVVKAGRFSAFEASDDPGVFNRLCRDPELIVDNTATYPWVLVKLKVLPVSAPVESPDAKT